MRRETQSVAAHCSLLQRGALQHVCSAMQQDLGSQEGLAVIMSRWNLEAGERKEMAV